MKDIVEDEKDVDVKTEVVEESSVVIKEEIKKEEEVKIKEEVSEGNFSFSFSSVEYVAIVLAIFG